MRAEQRELGAVSVITNRHLWKCENLGTAAAWEERGGSVPELPDGFAGLLGRLDDDVVDREFRQGRGDRHAELHGIGVGPGRIERTRREPDEPGACIVCGGASHGERGFFVDESGVIRFDGAGGAPDATFPPID